MRIAIFQTNLNIGGIQRALLSLLTDSLMLEHKIDLFLLNDKAEYSVDSLPSNVTVKRLSGFPSVAKVLPFRIARQMFSSCADVISDTYDLAIDFDGYSFGTAYYALAIKAHKTAIWVHSDYAMRLKHDPKFRLLYAAFKEKYRYFDCIVAVSQGVADSITSLLGIHLSIMLLPNLISKNEINKLSNEPIDIDLPHSSINIICVGRLDAVKNPEGSLREFAAACEQGAELNLFFLGRGPQERYLKKLSEKLGVSDRVFFLGAKSNPYPYMAKMDVLLFNSLYEGQGIVLREAQVLGLGLVFPKRLEKYNGGLHGVESISDSLCELGKKPFIEEHDGFDHYDEATHKYLKSFIDWAEE